MLCNNVTLIQQTFYAKSVKLLNLNEPAFYMSLKQRQSILHQICETTPNSEQI